jgi:multidrug efflux pump subunit AcrB
MIARFVAHPTAANLLMAAILLIGALSLPGLQRDTFPLIPASDVEIRVAWPGAAPEEVEEGICLPVEDALGTIGEMAELRCDARENLAIVTAEKAESADMAAFYDDVKSAVEAIDGLPDRARPPTVAKVERLATVATIAITGPLSERDLFRFAHAVRARLRADPMIALATVQGFSDREIEIALSDAALRARALTAADVAAAVERHSLDLSAGSLETARGETTLTFAEARRQAASFASIPVIADPKGATVLLGEIAEISERFAEPHRAAFFNGARAALIEIAKTDAQDTLRVREAVDRLLDAERAAAPPGIDFAISGDSAVNVRDRLRLILDNGLQGLLLVFAVMWLAFGLRLSFWVALGLPVSFLGALFAMQMLGLTINMITMVALLVAIGLLMDDAIVISENIVARRLKGDPPMTAAIEGAMQVAPGVISSFLTTIMIVGPLALMSGNIGAVLKFMPIVLAITLAVSLVEAFLVLPHHMVGSLDRMTRRSRVHRAVDGGVGFLRDRVVGPLVSAAVRVRYLSLGLVLALVVGSLAPVTAGWVKFQAFPSLDSDVLQARVLASQGTPLERTEAIVAQVLDGLGKLDAEFTPRQPGGAALVRGVSVQYGVNSDAPESGPHLATVSVDLLRAESRDATINELIQAWRRHTGPVTDVVSLKFTDRERGPAGKAVELMLTGTDLDRLSAASHALQRFLNGFRGVRDVVDDLRPGDPGLTVRLREDSASVLGVTAQGLAGQLRAAFNGDTGLEVQDPAGAIDVVVRLAEADRRGLDDVADLPIRATDGTLVPLVAVANVEPSRGWARIHRIDGRRAVTVSAATNPNVANVRELMAVVRRDFVPTLREEFPGIALTIGGETREAGVTGGSLQMGFLLGLAGVYAILALQFGGFATPLAVFAAIPLGLVGVIWGHLAMGLNLSMPSLVGLATLAGIVVNNAILLVVFMREGLARGLGVVEAAGEAAQDRFRAILLTSVTTVVGLTPLMLETSTQAQFLVPLVTSLAFGLTAATTLALVATPVTLAILEDFRRHAAPRAEGVAPAA